MSIVGGVDIHRKQLTFDYVEQETGRWERGRIAPADRQHLAKWAATEGEDSVSGTFSYMAPEQTGMLKWVVDGRSDLYSLGVTLFQCLTGRSPFVSADVGELMRMHTAARPPEVRALRPDVSQVIAAIVAKLLAKDPDDRYQSGEGPAADPERLAAGGGEVIFQLGSSDTGVDAAQAAMVGQEAELNDLLLRWDKARSGQGGVALVTCAAGGGKSRLVREFLTACGRDSLVLQGKSAPDEAVPLAPLRAAVEEHLPVALMLPTLSPSLADLIEVRQAPGENMQEQFTARGGYLPGGACLASRRRGPVPGKRSCSAR